jgi:hypothetical protein
MQTVVPLHGPYGRIRGAFDAKGNWVPGHLLNSDQTHPSRHLRSVPGEFQIQCVRFHRYR